MWPLTAIIVAITKPFIDHYAPFHILLGRPKAGVQEKCHPTAGEQEISAREQPGALIRCVVLSRESYVGGGWWWLIDMAWHELYLWYLCFHYGYKSIYVYSYADVGGLQTCKDILGSLTYPDIHGIVEANLSSLVLVELLIASDSEIGSDRTC